MRWTIELDVGALDAPTLKDDLTRELVRQMPASADGPSDKQVPAEDGNIMSALIVQAVAIAVMHKFTGYGTVALTRVESGAAMVSVHAQGQDAVVCQNLDPREVDKLLAERAAAAKAAARKVVVKAPGPAKTTAPASTTMSSAARAPAPTRPPPARTPVPPTRR